MALIRFEDVKLSEEQAAIVVAANRLLQDFRGRAVTLRHLYYRFVATDSIPNSWVDDEYNAKQGLPPGTKNTQKNYKKLGEILGAARDGGFVDWDAITDSLRQASAHREHRSAASAVGELAWSFRLDRWEGQPYYVELWGEKDTLEGDLAPIVSEFHVTLMINRGYSSISAMKESADRIAREAGRRKARPVVLYVGDHDPSGEHMARVDVPRRLRKYRAPSDLDVRKVALTAEQVRKYKCPPNPAKVSDARAKWYVEQYGDESWEVEALPPGALAQIVRAALVPYVDKQAMDVERAMAERGFFKDRNPKLSSGDAVRCANCDRFFIMGNRTLVDRGGGGGPRLLSWFQHDEDRRDLQRRRPTRLEACALCVERCWGGSGTGLFARWRPGARARACLAFKNAFFGGARGD